MNFGHFLIMLVGISAGAVSQPSKIPPSTASSRLPFTLEITANRVAGHSENWDFANCARSTEKAGSEVVIEVRKTNVSDHDISRWSLPGETEVRDGNGNPIKPRSFDEARGDGLSSGGGILVGSRDAVLQSGQSSAKSRRLDDWYEALKEPGTYSIQVSEHISDDPLRRSLNPMSSPSP